MKFNNKTLQIVKNYKVWHKWFAWRPVKVEDSSTNSTFILNNHVELYVKKTKYIWLETVWRKLHEDLPDIYSGDVFTWYEYRENTNNEVPK